MPENTDPELTTIVPSEDASEASITNIDNEVVSSASDDSPIDGLTRFGPGNIDSLRFKWTVRRVPEGYVVDETIGASISAFSTGPMSRGTALAFLDAREAEANQRFELLRQKFLEAQDRSVQNPGARNHASATDPQPNTESQPLSELVDTALEPGKETQSPPIAGGINVDDVMDRIVRLLDEH